MNGLPVVLLMIAWLSTRLTSRARGDNPAEKTDSMWTRCYDELGCLNNTAEWYHPVFRPLRDPPLERHVIKTTFRIFSAGKSADRPVISEPLLADYRQVKLTSFDRKLRTHVLIHDFTSNGLAGWIKHAARAMLERKMGNVIGVDWTGGAEPPYSIAVQNARVVGLELAHLMKILAKDVGAKISQFHLIGMGVGAHIAAYASQHFEDIGRITGLDPSGLYFNDLPCFAHLDSEDARLVDIIYTDVNKNVGQGSGYPLGHFNFYPNGALTQPGCNSTTLYAPLAEITRDALLPGDVAPGCSHKRAARYFLASIDEARGDCAFVGYACTDYAAFLRAECTDCQMGHTCAPMGYATGDLAGNMTVPPGAKFFLDTNADSPYCMFAYKIIVSLDPGDRADVKSTVDEETDVTVTAGIFCATVYSETEDLVFRTNLNMGASQKPFVTTGDNVYVTYQKGPKMNRPNKVVLRYDSEQNNTVIFVSKVKVIPMPKATTRIPDPLCGSHELTRFVPHSQEEFTPCRTSCKLSKAKTRRRRNPDDDISPDGPEPEYSDDDGEEMSPSGGDDYYGDR